MKRLIAAALLATVACVPVARAEFSSRQIRVSGAVPDNHPFAIGINAFAECVSERTDGAFKVDSYWSAALGSDQQAIQSVRSGTLEMVIASTSALTGLVPSLGVFDLPFLFENEKEADAVLDGPVGEMLSEQINASALVNMGFWENGFRNITNSSQPVQRWEDLQGMKIRVMQNNVFLDTFSNMGANAVPLAYGELYSALETKAVDGQENPFANIETAKFYEAQRYLSITNHAYTPAILLYSARLWGQLNDQEKGVLMACADVGKVEERRVNREQSQQSFEKLKEHGMVVNAVSPEEIQRMREKAQEVYQKHAQSIGTDIIELVSKQLAEIRTAD